MKHKISIVGMGYVGCGNALMLAKNNEVSIVDIDQQKVDNFNNKKLPIDDVYAQNFFEEEVLNISATTNLSESIQDASFAIISLPTDFNESLMQYDAELINEVVEKIIRENKKIIVVIKSTVNIGYTESLKQSLDTNRIIFSPEFLREGHALEDNLYPSRIIIGSAEMNSKIFGALLLQSSHDSSTPLLFMDTSSAESVKLFSNTYLAMRVAFFNELDGFCFDNDINVKDVINGVSHDKRIGSFYNNPSFGFGGYCLPKDSRQLLSRFNQSPHNLIQAIQSSNLCRIEYLSNKIIQHQPEVVGIYKLAMKEGSDNSRDSSIFGIINTLLREKIKVIVFDSSIQTLDLEGALLESSFDKFVQTSDLIITNRLDNQIKPFQSKVFTRDIFSSDE
jgi:UDPglucose 6-dehydrogenase